MSQTPKRTVGRRKAAEKSEQKWKEALEEDQTYEALPDVFFGSRVGSESFIGLPNNTRKSPQKKRKNSINYNSSKKYDLNGHVNTLNREKSHTEADNSDFTIIEDNLLKDIIQSLGCPTCFTTSLTTEVSKSNEQTVEISVFCYKCNENIIRRQISNPGFNLSMSFSSESDLSSHKSPKSKSDDGDSSNVELLVCDVDVMKEEQAKGNEVEQCKSTGHSEPEAQKQIQFAPRRYYRSEHIKPIRPCFFCSKMQQRLSRHVKTTHTNHPYVQNLLKQPKEIQAKMMRQLRSEGIFAENQRRIEAGRYDLLRIRNQGSGELSHCTYCRGYYKKKLLWRHRSTCIARPNNTQGSEGSDSFRRLSGEIEVLDDSPMKSPPGGQEDNNNRGDNPTLQDKGDGNNLKSPCNGDTDIQQVGGSDPPEINRIREILDGLEHGIFSQQAPGPTGVPGFYIKQEKEDYVEGECTPAIPVIPQNAAHMMSEGVTHVEHLGETANEDQLLFDSLPAILNNSNAAPCAEGGGTPFKRHQNGYSEDSYYYMWQDGIPTNAMQQQQFPCSTPGSGNRKRKTRSEFQYQFWKKEDEETILNYFSNMIKEMKVPGKDICKEFLAKYPDIITDWTRVKYKVYNQIQKQKKKLKKDLN